MDLKEARKRFRTGGFVTTTKTVKFEGTEIPRGSHGRVLEVKSNRIAGYKDGIEINVFFPRHGGYYLEHTDLTETTCHDEELEQFYESMRVDVYDDEENRVGTVNLPALIAKAIQNSGWSARVGKTEIGLAGQALGRMGGRSTSSQKTAASRKNGKLGGRPPKKVSDGKKEKKEALGSRISNLSKRLQDAIKKAESKSS